ncbi:chromosome partition protein Smc [Peptococcaceae bacterium CEB3]|nr:chromosome partition protein Smc [Peptococcaceae bacterium CEB3]
MITALRLRQFKSFEDAELKIGALTVLMGTNAAGKSNIRDAIRFFHGVSRGYTLAEILGEKWIEGGILQWRGIRGGTREAAYRHKKTFKLGLDFSVNGGTFISYDIEVEPRFKGNVPRIVREKLIRESDTIYQAESDNDPKQIHVRILRGGDLRKAHVERVLSNQPVLTQLLEKMTVRNDYNGQQVVKTIEETLNNLKQMKFLDLSPEAMRQPSTPGQTVLSDRGENLSSVLQVMCQDPAQKQGLLEWLKELTPLDAVDFEFPLDQTGRTLVTLIEKGGQKVSAYSASDGTLRFLSIIVALLGSQGTRLYVLEELENGIHPTRLQLLLQLMQGKVAEGKVQVIATTHSPQLVRLLNPENRSFAALVYRLPEQTNSKIVRLGDIPHADEVLSAHDLGHLMESGWMEDAVFFGGAGDER